MYTAREYDNETGLYFYRARYYDPKAGRFITKDPIGFAGGDYNLYAYVGNNPLSAIDPSGTELISPQEGLRIIAAGEKYIGTPYSQMDCSHFVNFAYNDAGFPYDYLPTYSFAQSPNFRNVTSCQVGDVTLFGGHMGIYNPNPPKGGYNILSATVGKGVIYGKAKWFGSPKGIYSCYRYDKCSNN
jgi:RHS repeat-associated protein